MYSSPPELPSDYGETIVLWAWESGGLSRGCKTNVSSLQYWGRNPKSQVYGPKGRS